MWEKGEAISSVYPGKLRNWNQLEKETGRRDVSLKSWHDLYQKWPDKKKYIIESFFPKISVI